MAVAPYSLAAELRYLVELHMGELSRAYHADDWDAVALKTLDVAEEVASLLNRLEGARRWLQVHCRKRNLGDWVLQLQEPRYSPGFEPALGERLEELEGASGADRLAGMRAESLGLKALARRTREFYRLWMEALATVEAISESYSTYGPGKTRLDLEELLEPVGAWLGANP